MMREKQTMFHTENAGLLPKSAAFAMRLCASPLGGGLQGCHGKANLLLGAAPALCTRCAPLGVH